MEHIIAQEVTATFSTPFFKTTKCNGKHEHVVLKVWLIQGRPLRYLQQGLMLGGKGSLWKKLFWDFSRLLFCFRNLLSQGFWTFLVDGCCADRATDQVPGNLKLVVLNFCLSRKWVTASGENMREERRMWGAGEMADWKRSRGACKPNFLLKETKNIWWRSSNLLITFSRWWRRQDSPKLSSECINIIIKYFVKYLTLWKLKLKKKNWKKYAWF